jgi:hypothetical protein
MAPENTGKSRLQVVLEQLAIIGGVTAIVSVVCGVADITPQRNAEITVAFFCFLSIIWYRQQVNRVPSAVLFALLVPAIVVLSFFYEGDACYRSAKRSHKPYEIHNITYFVKLEADPDPKFVNASHRIVYSLRATRDIKDSENLFDEEIHSDHDKAVAQRWQGTEIEMQHADIKPEKFQVRFPLKADEGRTIVTGVNFRIPFPYAPRSIVDGQQLAGPNDDTVSYPNTADDVICELVLIIESSSFGLSEMSHSGTPMQPVASKTDKNGVTTISARWSDIKPHEIAWIHYKIEPRFNQSAANAAKPH